MANRSPSFQASSVNSLPTPFSSKFPTVSALPCGPVRPCADLCVIGCYLLFFGLPEIARCGVQHHRSLPSTQSPSRISSQSYLPNFNCAFVSCEDPVAHRLYWTQKDILFHLHMHLVSACRDSKAKIRHTAHGFSRPFARSPKQSLFCLARAVQHKQS